MPNTSNRQTVNFGSETLSAAKTLQSDMNIPTLSDVTRYAITAMAALSEVEKRGCKIVVRSPQGKSYRWTLLYPKEMRGETRSLSGREDIVKLIPEKAGREVATNTTKFTEQDQNIVPLRRRKSPQGTPPQDLASIAPGK
jgi:hypothetical protein